MITEVINRTAEKTLDYFLRYKSFQGYINSRFKREGYVILPLRYLEGMYFNINGLKYKANDIGNVEQVYKDYDFSDIRETDIILDIGANAGVFSMIASQKAHAVYAVEPLFANDIRQNLALNNIKNINIIESGLGSGLITITFGGRQKIVQCLSLLEIIKLCNGHIDFLKLDCEGGNGV